MQEEMHEQMSGYKRMRREHQAALIKVGRRVARVFQLLGYKKTGEKWRRCAAKELWLTWGFCVLASVCFYLDDLG